MTRPRTRNQDLGLEASGSYLPGANTLSSWTETSQPKRTKTLPEPHTPILRDTKYSSLNTTRADSKNLSKSSQLEAQTPQQGRDLAH